MVRCSDGYGDVSDGRGDDSVIAAADDDDGGNADNDDDNVGARISALPKIQKQVTFRSILAAIATAAPPSHLAPKTQAEWHTRTHQVGSDRGDHSRSRLHTHTYTHAMDRSTLSELSDRTDRPSNQPTNQPTNQASNGCKFSSEDYGIARGQLLRSPTVP